MWQCYVISELRTVWQISNPIPKELEAHDFSRVSVHYIEANGDIEGYDWIVNDALNKLENNY